MVLLILKHKDKYIRHKQEEYALCDMDKASVFPMSKIQEVKDHLQNLRNNGFPEASVGRLIIKEVPFDIDEELKS